MSVVAISELIEKMHLKNLTPELDTENIFLTVPDVNRPALQLTGFFAHFDKERCQIIGNVERAYLDTLTDDRRRKVFTDLIGAGIPCLIYSNGVSPQDFVVELCSHYRVACLISEQPTSVLMADICRWLNEKMAPMISIHGVLVDVYGEGVLIMGESGIGKSEAAIELIKRGHRLVSDDVVEIRRISEDTLIGTAPAITQYFIELRGIGIIDVKTLFGVSSVKDSQEINMVIKLEEWNPEKEYDRLGMEEQYTEFLGNKIVCNSLPVRPGRNLAVIVESAAVNFRQKKMGYNAAHELYRRVQLNMEGKL